MGERGLDSLNNINMTQEGQRIQDTPVSTIAHLINSKNRWKNCVSLLHTQMQLTADLLLLNMTANKNPNDGLQTLELALELKKQSRN